MPGVASQGPMTTSEGALIQAEHEDNLNIRELMALAVRGLVQMFDGESQLFCFRLKRTEHGLVREGISHRYTMISLLGLQQLENKGFPSPISVKASLETLLKNTNWINNLGDLGLLLWLCALAAPERLAAIWSNLDVSRALTRYRDAREGRTMELAWFLSGLAHETLAQPEKLAGPIDLAMKTYEWLKKNQGDEGIFGHLARRGTFIGVVRGRIGSFADQVYPIYALTKFAQAFCSEEAQERALSCSRAICRAQGPLGQWWWHYDSTTGRVVGRYPVYAVHQDGMTPMALLALGEITGRDFNGPVHKGLLWIAGKNELGTDLRDTSAGVIWRCIHLKDQYKMYLDDLLSFRKAPIDGEQPRDLTIRFECRPYHFGWLLYAFAGISEMKPNVVTGRMSA